MGAVDQDPAVGRAVTAGMQRLGPGGLPVLVGVMVGHGAEGAENQPTVHRLEPEILTGIADDGIIASITEVQGDHPVNIIPPGTEGLGQSRPRPVGIHT